MLRPTAIKVQTTEDYQLIIDFDNQETRIYDIKKIFSLKPFMPLQNKSVFNTAAPNGISVEWSDDIDICPDDLYYGSVPYSAT